MSAQKKWSLLILDADKHLAGLMEKKFIESGWIVRSVTSLEAAEKALKRKQSDALLVDPELTDISEEDWIHCLEQAADQAKVIMLHTAFLKRSFLILWQKKENRHVLHKGEQTRLATVKRLKNLMETTYGS